MKNYKTILSTVFFALFTFAAYSGLASAHSFQSGENVNVGKDRKIDNTLFASGRTVDIASEVDGDVFCAGQSITISGTVHGDVICAGQTVNVTGTVDGDVRLAGQTVTVGAKVAGNATIASQAFTLGSNAKVDGDVSIGSSDGTFNGEVGRDLAAGGGNVIIANLVGRDIKGNIENLKLAENARVQGSIDFTSNNEITKANGSVVEGKVTRRDAPKKSDSNEGKVLGISVGLFIYSLLAMLILSLALVLFAPRLIHNSSQRVLAQPFKVLAVGLVAGLVVPIILIVLAITLVGIPLALVLALLWLVTLVLSGPFFGYFLGRLLLRGSQKPLLIMLAGSSLLLILYFVPIIGFLAFLAAVWFGTGMILLELKNSTPRPAYNLAAASATPDTKPAERKRRRNKKA